MSPHQIIAVAVRLFVVWLAVTFVFAIPVYYSQVKTEIGVEVSFPLYFLLGLFALALLFVLWRFPMTIAERLLAAPAREPEESASPDLWLSMGCALMGLWLLVGFIPQLVRDLMVVSEGYTNDGSYLKMRMAYDLPGVLIGLWLILGAKGFRKLFWWARNAGRSQPDR